MIVFQSNQKKRFNFFQDQETFFLSLPLLYKSTPHLYKSIIKNKGKAKQKVS